MAWISVHEQVIGCKLRDLAKEIGCSQNEALGILIRLWLWAINNVGKDGYISKADKSDLAEILNVGLDGKYDALEVVEAMITTRWLDVENGLYIHDWDEWQEQWYRAKEIRERDAARKREERKKKRLKQEKEKTEEPAKPKDRKEARYPTGFEAFWSVYPRKVGKAEGYSKYKARLNDGWSEDELLSAAKNYAAQVAREGTEPQYVKHAKTFLSENTPFSDYIKGEPDPATRPKGKKNGFMNFTERPDNDYEALQGKLIRKSFEGGKNDSE